MKNNLLTLILLIGLQVCAQTQIEKGSYQFITNIIEDFSPLSKKGDSLKIEINQGCKITVVGMSEDLKTVYVKYWNYPEIKIPKDGLFSDPPIPAPVEGQESNTSKASRFNNTVFEMPSEYFKKITEPLYQRYKGTSVGIYTIPFRLRGSGEEFDFESSLSLQANLVAGFGKRTKEYSWLDFSIGIGLSSVNLNSKNSNVTKQRTASAFTVSSGLVFKPSKYANLGIFVGMDNLGETDKEVNWVYNGELWIGLGVNISFNAITTKEYASGRNKKQRDYN